MRTSSLLSLLTAVCLRSASAFFLPPPPPPPPFLLKKALCKKQKQKKFLARALVANKILKKKKICKKKQARNALFVAAAATGGAVAVGAAAVALSNSNDSKPYQPPPDSMRGKVVVITGGGSGLGLESAKRLASAGATVVLTARSLQAGEDAVRAVRDYLSKEKSMLLESQPPVYNLVLNLDDLANVKAFPVSFQQLFVGNAEPVTVDVLLNNAGVMAMPTRELTLDGYERQFQSNHLGHFVLTAGLLPLFNSERSTVVNVASSAHEIAFRGLELDNLNSEKSYQPWLAYAQSKLCNILFAQELQRRAEQAGVTSLTAVAVHPGAVGTNLWKYISGGDGGSTQSQILSAIAKPVTNAFTKSVEDGASTQIFVAVSGGSSALVDGNPLEKGAYYSDLAPRKLKDFAKDKVKASALWVQSELLGGVNFDLNAIAPGMSNDESKAEKKTEESGVIEVELEADEEESSDDENEEDD